MRIWDTNYRRLEAGETVLAGDEFKTAGGWATTECPGVITEDPDMSQSLIYRRLKSIPVLLSGEWVVYEGRSYRFTGFVTAVCNDGQIVVQAGGAPNGDYRGMKHIYAASQLRRVEISEHTCHVHWCEQEADTMVDGGDGPVPVCSLHADDLENARISGKDIMRRAPTAKDTPQPGDEPGMVCASLGCTREATTHAIFSGLNTMLCEDCDRGAKFHWDTIRKTRTVGNDMADAQAYMNEAMEAAELSDLESRQQLAADAIARSARAFPAECLAAGSVLGVDLAVGPDENVYFKPAPRNHAFDCHRCSATMQMSEPCFQSILDGSSNSLYCTGCQMHHPVTHFSWSTSGDAIVTILNVATLRMTLDQLVEMLGEGTGCLVFEAMEKWRHIPRMHDVLNRMQDMLLEEVDPDFAEGE